MPESPSDPDMEKQVDYLMREPQRNDVEASYMGRPKGTIVTEAMREAFAARRMDESIQDARRMREANRPILEELAQIPFPEDDRSAEERAEDERAVDEERRQQLREMFERRQAPLAS